MVRYKTGRMALETLLKVTNTLVTIDAFVILRQVS